MAHAPTPAPTAKPAEKGKGRLERLMDILSNFFVAGEVLETLRGGEGGSSTPSKVANAVRGFSGVAGSKDERKFQLLLMEIGVDNRKFIEGFMSWELSGTDIIDNIFEWLYGNNFRTFITKMDADDKNTNGIAFLKWMADTIRPFAATGNIEDGYREVLASFENGNVPHMPKAFIEKLKEITPRVGKMLSDLPNQTERLKKHTDTRREKLGLFGKLLP